MDYATLKEYLYYEDLKDLIEDIDLEYMYMDNPDKLIIRYLNTSLLLNNISIEQYKELSNLLEKCKQQHFEKGV